MRRLKLATACQTEYHCNTHLPMWMDGTHPAAPGAVVTNKVCAIDMTGQDCCSYQSTVREVEPPVFHTRRQQPASHRDVTCDINFDHARRDVGFDVKFLFDGKPDRNVPPVHITDGVTRHADLDQNLLKGHMGQNVSCAVRTFFLTPPKPGTHFNSPYIPSNGYWVGIKIDTNRLIVGENEKPKTVSIYSTVPIRCPPPHDKTCNLEIELDPVNNNGQLTLVKDCNVHFTPAMWDPQTHRATTTFQVSATRDGKADKDKDIFLHFNPIFTADASPIFNNYQVPFMQILAKDKNTSSCWCTGDPHCNTLDTTLTKKGSYFDYYLIGEFTMYKSTTRDFQVQVRTWTCNGKVSCNCAVAMKEGNDVVSFPSGAQIKVTNNRGIALDVYITAPEDDFSGTQVFQPQLLANFPSVNGKSRAEAEKACNSAIDNNPTLQQCIAKAGLDFSNEKDICVEDFKYFDNGELVRSALHTAIFKCTDHVLRNVSLYDVNGNPPVYVTSELCPDYDCNDNGACVNGTCICNHGFVGDTCEINSQKAPLLYGVLSTAYIGKSVLCDVRERECVTSYVHGDNIYDNSRLSCRVRVMETVVGFNISVTNDGHTYSNDITAVRTDSKCANCLKSGTSCTVKSGTCLIEGNCRTSGEVNANNRNQQCDPTHSQTAWTNIQPGTPGESHPVTTPPTAPQGGTYFKRFDIWTFSQSGCQCAHNHALYTCACCDVGGCQCQAPNSNQCVKCGDTKSCGHPLAAPDNGVDGYTTAINDCECKFDRSQSNCGCCREGMGACQCGRTHRNQCVACDHMDQCGNKPWIFGPPMA
ncbi:VWDE-like protein [Mya arenaria]|uniref:VWDE-like protein n=1 Tax=Mya arenaria TaxID=6604 RepID=A0ABY7G4C2_MYAAR|nr:VWDE-like protein [Mya arenaria]